MYLLILNHKNLKDMLTEVTIFRGKAICAKTNKQLVRKISLFYILKNSLA